MNRKNIVVVFKQYEQEHEKFFLQNEYSVTSHMENHNYQVKYIGALGIYELYREEEMIGMIQVVLGRVIL